MQINNNFIKQHDRLVRTIVNQFKVANVDPEDLMQEGRIGLIEAAKRFDPSRGIQFASYASWWIRKYITKALQEYGNIVHIPHQNKEAITVCITESIQKIVKVENEEALTYEDILTDGEYIEQTIIEQEEQEELHQRLRRAIGELTPREQKIIDYLYGLNHQPLTTDQLAIKEGTSPNRIRRVHERAISKLKGILS